MRCDRGVCCRFCNNGTSQDECQKIALIAVMTAMSVAGRFVFAALPGFKPVTAVVVLCGMYLGADAGFICGALSALISNCYFGQGPWTPFQMLVWGIIGLVAGLSGKQLQKAGLRLWYMLLRPE